MSRIFGFENLFARFSDAFECKVNGQAPSNIPNSRPIRKPHVSIYVLVVVICFCIQIPSHGCVMCMDVPKLSKIWFDFRDTWITGEPPPASAWTLLAQGRGDHK